MAQPRHATESVQHEKLADQARDVQEEARMVLPGVQALFGFQLIGAFNQRFMSLNEIEQTLYFVALLLVTCAIAVLMAPAAYHRIAERGVVSPFFLKMSSRLIASGMIPLALSICIDVYIVSRLAVPHLSAPSCAAIAIALLVMLVALWFAFPLWRLRRGAASR